MGRKGFKVEVKPAVLRWARQTAGYSISKVAQRLTTSDHAVEQWESGERLPTWRTLDQLAGFYKRPVAALLLPAAPKEPTPPSDFRKLPGARKELSPETRLAVRLARWLARHGEEIERELGIKARPPTQHIRLSDDPEQVGARYRARLGVDLAEQKAFKNVWEAFRRWREALEQQQVFVFQLGMPSNELLGFSVFEQQKAVIVVNQSDPAISRRIFTLFHEYGHLLLAQPGICIPEEGAATKRQDIETFCNRFAAALLIPQGECERWKKQVARGEVEEAIAHLSKRYQVSRYVVLGRMRTVGLVSAKDYKTITERWKAEGWSVPPPTGGGPTTAKRCMNQRGRRFVSLVLDATQRELITTNDALNYLGVKLKDLDKLYSETRQNRSEIS